MTEVELRAFMALAEREFVSMLRKFGATTPKERAQHAGLLAGYKDGMLTIVRWLSDRGMLVDREPGPVLRTVSDLVAETKVARLGDG